MWKRAWAIFSGVVAVLDIPPTIYFWLNQIPIGSLAPYQILGIGIAIFFVATLALLVSGFLMIRDKKQTSIAQEAKDKLQNKVTFYEKRPNLDVAEEFVNRHSIVNAVFATGQILGGLAKYKQWGCFKNLVLLKPHGEHLKIWATRFYDKDEEHISKNIEITKDTALPHVTSFFYRDDCLPFSLMIGDPEQKLKRGEILLELHIPYTEADERPMIIFKQEDYPSLFEVLKSAYDKILNQGEQIK